MLLWVFYPFKYFIVVQCAIVITYVVPCNFFLNAFFKCKLILAFFFPSFFPVFALVLILLAVFLLLCKLYNWVLRC